MFAELQGEQIEKWLLNPAVYGVVAALIVLTILRPSEKLDRRYIRETGSDFLYGVMYVLLYFPLIAISLNAANAAIDHYTPWLRLDLLSEQADWVKFIVIVLMDDFLAYWSHRWRHEIRPLWHFHAIHHSQERLNPFTTKRFHPLENLAHKLVIMMVPLAIVGGSMEVFYLYFLLDAVWDYFIHSSVRINLGPLRHILVSPQYHKVHHSTQREHFDANYADRFVIWDWMFGTMVKDSDVFPATGVPGYPNRISPRWLPLDFLRQHLVDLWYPFKMIARDWRLRRQAAELRQ